MSHNYKNLYGNESALDIATTNSRQLLLFSADGGTLYDNVPPNSGNIVQASEEAAYPSFSSEEEERTLLIQKQSDDEERTKATEEQGSIQDQFRRFDEQHPEIYQEFRQIALELFERGRKHYGSKALLEVIRYHRVLSGQDEKEPFKINNNYSSRYARKLISEDDRFRDFFELRELRSI